ncbi:unnamed protein product [Vitrella brassicaformis CCMP3155]|uniref:Uncharacterized protein n=2 Tax=Vitrella brassicaformis TaxID=1169539 RepID=A0A0G4FCJ1_VITBC|nr:unnamed protein product [Vitrella brassicaformis CCMP3155]|eukprot:CEM10943.1 unnamed protein product [Vitrella brassicaformis CCMP3155]
MAAAASSSSATAADRDHGAGLPLPQATSSSDQDRPTLSPPPLSSIVISKAAHLEDTRRALLSQINDDQDKESITSAVTQLVKEHIEAQLAAKGLEGIITLSADLTSLDLLLRLAYFIDKSGEWTATVPIVRVAKHQGRGGGQLPIELRSADVEGVGSRAVFDGRCEAVRQLSLIGRHIGMELERVNDGERLDGHRLTIRKAQTLPADHPFRNGYDEANPVCELLGLDHASVRDAVLNELGHGGSLVAHQDVTPYSNAPIYDRLRRVLATQPPPVWDRCTISTSHAPATGYFERVILLHGGEAHDTFAAHIIIYTHTNFASSRLYTTERPVDGKKRAARFPQTVRLAREVLGADAHVVLGGN